MRDGRYMGAQQALDGAVHLGKAPYHPLEFLVTGKLT